MLVQFSVRPVPPSRMDDSLSNHGKRLSDAASVSSNSISACGEGPWEQIMATIKGCHQSLATVHPRVVTTIIVVDDRNEMDELSDETIRSRRASIHEICVV